MGGFSFLYTLSRFSNAAVERDGAVSRIVEYIEKNFSSAAFSVSEMASDLGYNVKYISHLFKSEKGMGINEYLRNLRINHAVFLFDHGIDSVKNVALLSGFSDPLYFSSVFKKQIGVSPKEYKEGIGHSGAIE